MSEDVGKPKDPIVLDAEGHVVHDPFRDSNEHRKPRFEKPIRAVTFSSVGLVPKVLLGVAFAALLILGLTFAGVALGVIFVGFLVRTIFRPRKR